MRPFQEVSQHAWEPHGLGPLSPQNRLKTHMASPSGGCWYGLSKKNALVNPIKRSNLDRVELKWVHAHGIICAHDLTLNIYPPGFEANPDDPKWHCMSWSCSANPKGQHWFLLLCSFGLSTALGFRRGVLGFLARFGLFALWLMGLACLALSVELLGIPGLSDGWT